MPIRIQRDPSKGGFTPRRSSSGGGSGNPLGSLLPILLGLFGRNPKLLLLVAVIGIIVYFAGGKGCNSSSSEMLSGLTTGANFDPEKYRETEIYEPLADNVRNPLPEKISLLPYAPPRLNQGEQGSCVAWASAYAARTILEAKKTGQDPKQVRFSPAFLYNQIALEGCQGAYLPEAMKVMKGKGLAPFEDFPYSDQHCSEQPGTQTLRKAEQFKIDGYQRLTPGNDPSGVDMLAIKQNLAQGAPVVIGMMVGGSFMQDMMGQAQWIPADRDYTMSGFGGHAMCVIGYDDYVFAQDMGGFLLMNSWGNEWGDNGVAWVSYADFAHFVKEAYGLYPLRSAITLEESNLDATFGIVLNATDENLEFHQSADRVFTSTRKMKSGEQFKIEVTNNIPCYVYVFGMETDGSSYVLFPYTDKHSPYCGITGTRLFPKDHSLYPDETGSRDYFALLITRDPVDYTEIEKQLDTAAGSTYADKLARVIGPNSGVFSGDNGIHVNADFRTTDRVGVVIEVLK